MTFSVLVLPEHPERTVILDFHKDASRPLRNSCPCEFIVVEIEFSERCEAISGNPTLAISRFHGAAPLLLQGDDFGKLGDLPTDEADAAFAGRSFTPVEQHQGFGSGSFAMFANFAFTARDDLPHIREVSHRHAVVPPVMNAFRTVGTRVVVFPFKQDVHLDLLKELLFPSPLQKSLSK